MSSKNRRKPVVARITDGLGNQLFQYAFAYGIYRRTGRGIILDPMYSGRLRHYQLDSFQIDFDNRFIQRRTDCILGLGARNAAPLRLKYREWKIKCCRYKVVRESSLMRYDDGIDFNADAYYIGFWQSYQYFDSYYNDIKRQFQIKDKLGLQGEKYSTILKNSSHNSTVSLHIRRTDYNRSSNNVCLGDLYYKQALDSMQREIGDFSLFVFTDDKEFVKEHFHLHEYTLVEGLSDLEEFTLMQKCEHHIIANSTYSWWAAYLSENKGGIVYAPLSDIWTEQFYLPQWKKIDTQVGYSVW